MTSEAAQTTADLPRIDALLAAAGHSGSGSPTRIAAGTLNRNHRVAPFLDTTDEQLRRFADEAWRNQLAERLVAAAVG